MKKKRVNKQAAAKKTVLKRLTELRDDAYLTANGDHGVRITSGAQGLIGAYEEAIQLILKYL